MAALEPEATTSLEPEEEPTEVPESEATRQRQIQILRVKQAWRATRQSTTRTSCYPCTQEFRLIRRFVITQASNKQRIIDDAAADAWGAIHIERGSMARQPPLPLAQYHRWQQHSLTDTFASHFPEEVFERFSFPYNEDLVNLPAFNRYAAWVEGRGTPPGCPSPPSYVSKIAARTAR